MNSFCLLINDFGKPWSGVSPVENKSGLGNLMIGKHLKCLDQGRVIEIFIAGVEQFLGSGRVRKAQAQFTGTRKRQVEVFLVQGDTESRVESTLDHTLTMNFQNL